MIVLDFCFSTMVIIFTNQKCIFLFQLLLMFFITCMSAVKINQESYESSDQSTIQYTVLTSTQLTPFKTNAIPLNLTTPIPISSSTPPPFPQHDFICRASYFLPSTLHPNPLPISSPHHIFPRLYFFVVNVIFPPLLPPIFFLWIIYSS